MRTDTILDGHRLQIYKLNNHCVIASILWFIGVASLMFKNKYEFIFVHRKLIKSLKFLYNVDFQVIYGLFKGFLFCVYFTLICFIVYIKNIIYTCVLFVVY